MSMTRREFTRHLAIGYAQFEADVARTHGPDQKIQPLNREYAFSNGRRTIEAGLYKPRGDYRYMDWTSVAYEARKQLPYARKLIANYGV